MQLEKEHLSNYKTVFTLQPCQKQSHMKNRCM